MIFFIVKYKYLLVIINFIYGKIFKMIYLLVFLFGEFIKILLGFMILICFIFLI